MNNFPRVEEQLKSIAVKGQAPSAPDLTYIIKNSWKIYVPVIGVFWNVHTISDNHDKNSILIDHSPARWGSRWRVQCWFYFSLKGSTLREIYFFLPLNKPHKSHVYCRRFLGCPRCPAKIYMSIDWVKWYRAHPSELCDPIGERSFPDNVVIKFSTNLTMWFIWDLPYFFWYELKTF